jgi:hypothetical protein
MKCPKCGFDQPDDRFCANCGVDVALYVPKRKTLKTLLRSTTFLVLLTTFVLVFGIWFLLSRERPPDDSILNADRANSIFKKARPTAEEPEEDVGGAASEEVAPTPTTETFQAQAPAPAVAPTAPTLRPKATTFRLAFYEVDFDYAGTLLGATVDGNLGIGIVTNDANSKYADRLKTGTDRGSVRRIGSSIQTISTDDQTPNTFSFVSNDPRIGGEIGLMFQLRAGVLTETGSPVSIEGRRIIGREDAVQADILNFQRDVVIPLTTPAYIVGLVRGRNPIDNNELNAFSANPVFSIFRSEKFRANQSLLVVLIEAVERP